MDNLTETADLNRINSAAASIDAFNAGDLGQFAIVPEGYEIQSLEEYQDSPNRIFANHSFVDVRSLAIYLNRFATANTMVCADYEGGKIACTIDGDGPDEASHKSHSATFRAMQSDVLKAWLRICGKGMSQVDFGLFLEDRAIDVIQPESADVMDMVMKFDATKKVTFKSSTRLSDGSRQFQYVEENDQRGGVTLPDHFIILAPLYRGMEPQKIKFMVRYRISDGSLRFQVDMHDRDEVFREAMDRCVDALKADMKADLPIYVTG